MSISAVSSSQYYDPTTSVQQVSNVRTSASSVQGRSKAGGASDFRNDLLSALKSAGLDVSSLTNSSSATASNSSTSSSTSNVSADDALKTFMHALFQATHKGSGGGQPPPPPPGGAQGPPPPSGGGDSLSSKLKELADSLTSTSTTSTDSSSNDLLTAFESLKKALSGSTSSSDSTTSSSQTASQLASFLEALASSANKHDSESASKGNFVSTSA